MSFPAGQFATYKAVGNREDLTDIITNISPTDTPLLSMSERGKATGVLHEWQTDSLKSAARVAREEGDDANYKEITASTRLNNYCQIIDNAFLISETQESVKHAGRGSEIEYQTAKAMKELANDIEYALIVNSAAASAGASGTARVLKGMRGFVTTNTSTASADRDFTAALIDTQMAAAWLAGGRPDTLLMGTTAKLATTDTTNFPGITRNVQAEAGAYKMFVDIYQGAIGGTMKIVTSTIMANASMSNEAYGLEMSKWRTAWLRDTKRSELAKTGDGRKFQIVAELTLESLAENANFAVKDVS